MRKKSKNRDKALESANKGTIYVSPWPCSLFHYRVYANILHFEGSFADKYSFAMDLVSLIFVLSRRRVVKSSKM